MPLHRFLPPDLDPARIRATIGLLSDTHMPQRRRRLPTALYDVMAGVDLLLHAGDVGELWVLDQLSAIAPVVAVHGNDDSADSQRELPYQQLLTIAGLRILLWHSHFPDWDQEMTFRADDSLYTSVQRQIDQAQRAGAKLVIFGHWHIPFTYRASDILVVNPGALASGNEFTRMLRHTVALLFVDDASQAHVVHVDLAAPDRPYVPAIDWDAGFMLAHSQFSASILAPELESLIPFLRRHIPRPELLILRDILCELGHPIWEGEARLLTYADYSRAVDAAASQLPGDLYPRLRRRMDEWHAAQPNLV